MLKPSGLKIPGRAVKHSSPVGRASGTAAATVTTGTKEGRNSVSGGNELSQVMAGFKGKDPVMLSKVRNCSSCKEADLERGSKQI